MAGSVNWRNKIDIDEENRLSGHRDYSDPDRCVAVLTVKCEGCGESLTEVHFANGRRSFVEHGVRTVQGKGSYCRICPTK